MQETDFLIVGAGVAGASIAYRLAPNASVMVIDMEDQAGYHTTGRSAAFYAETYGGPLIQPLTSASKGFFHSPPGGFSEAPLISPRGVVHVFRQDQSEEAKALFTGLKASLPDLTMLTQAEVLTLMPQLLADNILGGIYDPNCSALDVAALHQGFLKGAKQKGAKVVLGSALTHATFQKGRWAIDTPMGLVRAKIVINAAGAWADKVAEYSGVRPLGLAPLRRTVVTIANPENLIFCKKSPIAMQVGAENYFKPEGHGYLISPGDEVFMPPCDVQPEQEDIALAVYQFEQATGATVKKVEAKWAGLRSFAKDRAPIIGFAADMPSFFWSAGHGGFGIQTAPAWSELAAALVTGQPVPERLLSFNVRAEHYSPARLL